MLAVILLLVVGVVHAHAMTDKSTHETHEICSAVSDLVVLDQWETSPRAVQCMLNCAPQCSCKAGELGITHSVYREHLVVTVLCSATLQCI